VLEGRLSFQYCGSWLAHPQAMGLSLSLPLQGEAFEDQQCRAFFGGLLPEGQLRQLIAQQFQISRQNDFGLLEVIGGDCAGAVSLRPAGSGPENGDRSGVQKGVQSGVEWLNGQQLALLLDELPRRPMLAGRDGIRLSLAGAQDKLPVLFDGERLGLPRGNTASTHILKPAIAAVQDSVSNEAFCMALAAAMGLPTARAEILSVADRQVLLVGRYDRRMGDDTQGERLHQEDFCQALGVVPELKYQNEGGPDLQRCFELLRRATRPSAPQVLRLLDAVIFNALIGNHDAHAKNFSLLYAGETHKIASPTLAPLYDLLCTAVYPTLTAKMAMKMGSTYRFSDVRKRHWERFALDAGLSGAQTRKRLMRIAQELPQAVGKLQSEPVFRGNELINKIAGLIEQRCALTLHRLVEE
jgi:serine/threonine-protein kinase HipA